MSDKFGSAEVQRLAREKKQRLLALDAKKNTVKSIYIKNLMPTYQYPMYEILNGKNSMKQAIKMKCLDCTCFQKDEVRNCNVVICPLYNFRPYQVKSK